MAIAAALALLLPPVAAGVLCVLLAVWLHGTPVRAQVGHATLFLVLWAGGNLCGLALIVLGATTGGHGGHPVPLGVVFGGLLISGAALAQFMAWVFVLRALWQYVELDPDAKAAGRR